MTTYLPSQCVVFCKTKEAFGGLSNMAAGFPIEYKGSWKTSEALYQACRFPGLTEIQEAIRADPSPMGAKFVSKRYIDQTRPNWETLREPVMWWCLILKRNQNPSFREILLSTGSKPIVEFSKKDDFWGAKPQPDGSLLGQNRLGILLSQLRYATEEELKPFTDQDWLRPQS